MKRLFCGILSLLALACVEPYDLDYAISKNLVIVDGSISDQNAEYFVTLKESNAQAGTISPLRGAQMAIVVDGKEQIPMKDLNANGVYFLPSSFKAQPGKTYALTFKLANGSSYASTEERITTAPEIDQIYHDFRPDGLPFGSGRVGAHYVFLDTKDPAGVKNNYFWTWRLWEKQNYCADCENGRIFYNSRLRIWECRQEAAYNGVIFDYACNAPCWEIFYNQDLNVLSDQFIDGKDIKARLVAKIPTYQPSAALLEIRQQTVSAGAYRYLKLLVEQGQNTGSLADTPPAALIGNVKNINDPLEAVGGTFLVASTRTKLYRLDRKDAQGVPFVGLLGGRPLNPEPSNPNDLSRPPIVPCNASNSRTPIKPIGWID